MISRIKFILFGSSILGLDPKDAVRVAEEARVLKAEWKARGRNVRIRIGSPWVDFMTDEQVESWKEKANCE